MKKLRYCVSMRAKNLVYFVKKERCAGMTEELRAQLMGVKLTKKEKLIAEFVLDHFAEACFITSTEIEKD